MINRLKQLSVAHPSTLLIPFVFMLALMVRVLFVLQWDDLPYAHAPLLDAQVYDMWATEIAQGSLLRGKAFYQSPLYPYLCGLLYAVFGHSSLVIGLFNALLGAASIAILTALTGAWFGAGAALAAGLLGAFYRPFLFYTAPLMKEPLALFLLTLFVAFIFRGFREEVLSKNTESLPRRRESIVLDHKLYFLRLWMPACAGMTRHLRDHAWAGAMLGLGVLVRGNVLIFAPFVLAFGFWRMRSAYTKQAAVFVASLMLCIAPATLHNYVVSKDFVLTNYTDGFNLYIGNSPTANGTNAYPPEVSTDPVQEEMNTIWRAQEDTGRPLKPSEVSAYWRGRAVDYILTHPARTLELTAQKILAFWNGTEKFDNYDIGFIEKNFGTLLVLPLPTYGLVTFLAAFGAIASWPRHRGPIAFLGVMIGAYMATCALFYITDRYRLPVVLFLLPLAGASFPAFVSLIQTKKFKRLVSAFGAALVFLLLALRPDPDAVDLTAYNWGTLSMIYADEGRDQDALSTLDKAIQISPIEAGAAAYVRGSYAFENLGRDMDAENLLKRAMAVFPDNGIVQYNYGRFLAARGRLPEALTAFEKGLALSPFYLLNYYALAKGYGHQGDIGRAVAVAKRGLRLDPSDPLLNDILSQLLATSSGTQP